MGQSRLVEHRASLFLRRPLDIALDFLVSSWVFGDQQQFRIRGERQQRVRVHAELRHIALGEHLRLFGLLALPVQLLLAAGAGIDQLPAEHVMLKRLSFLAHRRIIASGAGAVLPTADQPRR